MLSDAFCRWESMSDWEASQVLGAGVLEKRPMMMDSEEGGSGLFWWLMLAGLLDIFFGSETVAGFMRLFQLLRCGVSETIQKFCTHWEIFFLSAEVV